MTPYDPQARRDTPLALLLKERIRREGAMTVEAFMQACLHDEAHGYYRTQPAIGRGGDFITAPEIAQVFGELIGLWAAVVWQQMGAPAHINLVELGPGRGTLLRDALRASRIVPGFHDALSIHLVETNPALREQQAAALASAFPSFQVSSRGPSPGPNAPPDRASKAAWHTHLTEVPPGPTIIIGNEFLDVFPVNQHVKTSIGWQERGVGLSPSGDLTFVTLAERPTLFPADIPPDAPIGSILETCPGIAEIGFGLSRLAAGGPIAALFIDYGHWGQQPGETLQAMRAHRYEHPLTSPGEADLTAHVNFEALARTAQSWHLAVDAPVSQAEFLGSLGIVERTSKLMSANPTKAATIEAGVLRLMSPGGMGSRFKAIGVRSVGLPPLPGLPLPAKSSM